MIVVVTPVYEDVEAASRLFLELARELGPETFVVAVDDGSVRQPLPAASIAAAGLNGVVINLRRNLGHQRAIAVGLGFAAEKFPAADCIVTMDSDGEDVPSTIAALTAPLASPDVDIVVAKRNSRVETLSFRSFYLVYKFVFLLLSGRGINFGNFIAFKPHAVARLVAMQELWTHVAGCVLTSRLRIARCGLDRGPRYAGKSKMNFSGLVLHGFRALMVFAEDVLVRVGIFCAAIAALSVAGILLSILLKFAGFATPGWFSVALGILVLMLLQTGALTLMVLMLTGVVRAGSNSIIDHRIFIKDIVYADGDRPAP